MFRVGLLDSLDKIQQLLDKPAPRYAPRACISRGEVAERLKAAVLKTARAKVLVGSNPTLSASSALPWPGHEMGCQRCEPAGARLSSAALERWPSG